MADDRHCTDVPCPLGWCAAPARTRCRSGRDASPVPHRARRYAWQDYITGLDPNRSITAPWA